MPPLSHRQIPGDPTLDSKLQLTEFKLCAHTMAAREAIKARLYVADNFYFFSGNPVVSGVERKWRKAGWADKTGILERKKPSLREVR